MNDKKLAIRYPGGKGGNGVFQKIINLMPHHDVYIETHLGGGNIFFRKKRADLSIVIDIDNRCTSRLAIRSNLPAVNVINGDAAASLKNHTFDIYKKTLIYCDPPYLLETRTVKKIYQFEYTDEQHRELLETLLAISAANKNVYIMVSGYFSKLYSEMLSGWRRVDFNAMTRGGLRVESVWLNFNDDGSKSDYRYLGESFRERERIKRKQERWVNNLKKMPIHERMAMLARLQEVTA